MEIEHKQPAQQQKRVQQQKQQQYLVSASGTDTDLSSPCAARHQTKPISNLPPKLLNGECGTAT